MPASALNVYHPIMYPHARFLLLQSRDAHDPMGQHEVEAFARVLQVKPAQIDVFDLLTRELWPANFARHDLLLLGGSGDYSVLDRADWLERALDSLRRVHVAGKPTFASCWGFQAFARALGGRVGSDPEHTELGTITVQLTEAGRTDPVFAPLTPTFLAQAGHQDYVAEVPARATLLASSERVRCQAYRFDDAPIYCTQFHPELARADLLVRVHNYPEYIEKIAGMPLDTFAATLQETIPSEGILRRFAALHLRD
ncbi:MAG: type 1 glutamine amidotransferase [Gemmataceae bacterium]